MSFFGSHAPKPVQTEEEALWYLNLNADQQKAYDKFRAHLAELNALHPGHDDKYTLLRFLKARQYDVHKATTMYTNMTKWRQEHKVDELHRTFKFDELDKVFEVYPHFLHKTDKYGRPVYVELLGQTDAHKILELTTLERIMAYHLCEWEELERRVLPAASRVAGRPIVTKTVILDLKGLSMKNFGTAAQKMLKAVAHMDQDYYPEHLGQMFIINTPLFFRAIWAIVNPMLEDRTRRKIIILGSDYLPTVAQLVPLERLPTQLGGKSVVADMKVNEGPWVAVMEEMDRERAASAAAAATVTCTSPAAEATTTTTTASPLLMANGADKHCGVIVNGADKHSGDGGGDGGSGVAFHKAESHNAAVMAMRGSDADINGGGLPAVRTFSE